MVNKSLLVGINYINSQYALNGCINDVILVKNRLMNDLHFKEENIVVLRDDDRNNMPTCGNILGHLVHLIKNSNPQDNIYIHFSGHGTHVKDNNNDEKDGRDEVFVPCDYRKGLISDDMLFSIISTTNCNTLLVFDCCHSGSICDLPYRYDCVNNTLKLNMENNRALNKKITMISGCRDEQSSLDYFNREENKYHGLLTVQLMNYLKKTNYTITFKDLVSNIHKLTDLGSVGQNPNVSASYSDFLKDKVFNTEEYLEQQSQIIEENDNLQETQKQDNAKLQQDNAKLQQDNAKLQQDNAKLQQENNSTKKVLEQKNTQINNMNNHINNLHNKINHMGRYINYLRNMLSRRR